jgi:predicted O-linked N-acetylglucosamine transferase (SPINDLY family)
MAEKIGIIQTRGIGDIIIGLPIADFFLERGMEVCWPVDEHYAPMFQRVKPEIKFVGVERNDDYFLPAPQRILKELGCSRALVLYSYLNPASGPGYDDLPLARYFKFDEYKYAVAGVPFARKWDLRLKRDMDREMALHEKLAIRKKYVCRHVLSPESAHTTRLAGQWADEYQIVDVEPITDSIFDWIYTLEHAEKLLLVDSCFSNLVEQLNMPVEKYLILRTAGFWTPVFRNDWKFVTPQQDKSNKETRAVPQKAAGTSDLYARAMAAYQSGDRAQTERLCQQLLRQDSRSAEAAYLLGVLALDAGRAQEAMQRFGDATKASPQTASYHHALGEALNAVGRTDQAIDSYRRAIELDVNLAAAHNALGQALLDRNDAPAAAERFRIALRIRSDYDRAHMNLGRALHVLGDLPKAQASFMEAVRINPRYSTAHNNLGAVLQAQGQLDLAFKHFREALSLRPDYPEAHFNLGGALMARGETLAAAERFAEAIRLRPNYARAHAQMGHALFDLGQVAAAVESFKKALALAPDDFATQMRLGEGLRLLGRLEESLAIFERAMQSRPDSSECFARLFQLRAELCDWRDRDSQVKRLWSDAQSEMEGGKATSVYPLSALALPWSPAQQLAIARSHARDFERAASRAGPRPAERITAWGRLKVGYLSRDFYDHPVGHLIYGLFGLHDREKFDVHVYSFGPNDSSTYRKRIENDCEHFRDVQAMSLNQLDTLMRKDGIQILVDLMAYTGLARTACLALRPAPIQVSWLGYAGTMGADFIDYIIGDAVVTPTTLADAYSERIVRLPHTYMITDANQAISPASSRADHGLPADAIVFCCFNNAGKLEPSIFECWMRILNQVPGSVLWLGVRQPTAQGKLRSEARSHGVDDGRLAFAGHVSLKADHLARLRLADLFVDTHHYNAHATAADALSAGLPVLTYPGETFASRVAASVLTAAGLPELIAPDLPTYERRAIELARDPGQLQRLRRKLQENRPTMPLFDTPRYVRHLEAAYLEMWRIRASGRQPEAIDVKE